MRVFCAILDYNLSSEMTSVVQGKECAKVDWMRFLLGMCRLMNIRFDFIQYADDPEDEPLLDEDDYRENIVSTMVKMRLTLCVSTTIRSNIFCHIIFMCLTGDPGK